MRAHVPPIALIFLTLLAPAAVHGTPPTGSTPRKARGLVLVSEPDPAPLTQTTAATEYAQRHYAHRVAVTIGVDAYPGRPWPHLTAAVADARHMADLFRAMGFDRVESLEDQAGTRDGILDLLERRLPLMVGERDLVVVYFAGHGAMEGGQGYVVPRDATGALARTAIPVQRLKESALRMRIRHTVFMLDACFSGLVLRRADLNAANQLAYWEAAAQDRVVQILTAGSANEIAHERDGWGDFTRALHAGLAGAADRNRDGVVTTEELAVYANERVLRDGTGPQHPQWGTLEGSGTALFLDIRRLPASAQPTPPPVRPVVRGLEGPIAGIHALMERRDWAQAERLLRDLTVEHPDVELRLLLAEVYIEADTLGNVRLIDTALRYVAQHDPTPDQRQRMLDLRARLDKAQRAPL